MEELLCMSEGHSVSSKFKPLLLSSFEEHLSLVFHLLLKLENLKVFNAVRTSSAMLTIM